MSFKLSAGVSRSIVIVAGVCTLGVSCYFVYMRQVLGHPMRVVRDDQGLLRMQTRREKLEKDMETWSARRQESPDDLPTTIRYLVSARLGAPCSRPAFLRFLHCTFRFSTYMSPRP